MKRDGNGDVMKFNNLNAQISVAPIMKITTALGDNTMNDIVLLPGEANKSYVIHGFSLSAIQTAGTNCAGVTLYYTDYWSGDYIPLHGFTLTPAVASNDTEKMLGFNLLTFPGKPVFVRASVAAPYYKGGTLYYSEVEQ